MDTIQFLVFHQLSCAYLRVEGQVLLTLDPPGHAQNRTNFSTGGQFSECFMLSVGNAT